MKQMISLAKLLVVAAPFASCQAPAFEVASVKFSSPGTTGGRMQFLPGGRFIASNVSLTYLLQQIYEVRDFQIAGASKWMSIIADGVNSRYEIEAKAASSSTEVQMREMVKVLLADRFQLNVHKETRELPVYVLTAAKTGMKLAVSGDNARPRGSGAIALMDRGWIQGTNVTMRPLIQILSRSVDRPVVDRTNFTEAFDFKLQWTPDPGASVERSTSPSDIGCPSSFTAIQQRLGLKPEVASCPSIFTAVQEQLGLRLDPRREPIEVLVVDHVEPPSAN